MSEAGKKQTEGETTISENRALSGVPVMEREVTALLEEISSCPETAAVAVGGSRATGKADKKSDYDIYVYVEMEIAKERRKSILEKYCGVMEIGNHYWESEDNCTLNNGVDIDIIYRKLQDFEGDVAAVVEQYRASNNANLQCKESIEAAVREHFDGMYLSHDAAKGVIETYGMERVAMVLANTVQLQNWDGRYSRRNKEWAKTIPNENPEIVRCGYVLNSHPAVLDGFIDLVREEQQRSRTQGEKTQPSRPSVRDKLKQELPVHKPAAPKKREPER